MKMEERERLVKEEATERGLREGRIRGREEGRIEGRIEGSDRMASLTKKLLEADRMADLQLALDDPGYREKLMDEYGIK